MSIFEGWKKKSVGHSAEEIAGLNESRISDPNEAQEVSNNERKLGWSGRDPEPRMKYMDPGVAHEEANMLTVEQGINWDPTAEDYDESLALLERLQEEASQGSATMDKVTKPFRVAMAGVSATAPLELLALTMLNLAHIVVPVSPKKIKNRDRRMLIEKLKEIPANYQFSKKELATARECLEEWKIEAEKVAQSQNAPKP